MKRTIIRNYILAFFLLMGFYLGDYLGITDWAFVQPLPILLGVLTLYYGTWIIIVERVLDKVLK